MKKVSKLHQYAKCPICGTALHATTITAGERRSDYAKVNVKNLPVGMALICRIDKVVYATSRNQPK